MYWNDNTGNPMKHTIKERHYIYTYCCLDFNLGVWNMVEVELETIGQYTGLHDKNEKEIYEGDIVEVSEEGRKLFGTNTKKYQLVGFKDGAFMTCRNKFAKDRFDTYLWILKDYISVKGNIYENKELLEGN